VIKKAQATVYVTDIDSALKFYSGVLGMHVRSHWGRDFAELETPGITIGLHPSTNGPRPGTKGAISIGLEVDDLDSEIARLKEKGVAFQGNILEDGPVRLAFFGDPDGNSLYLTQVKRGMWG
jgi:catechol 2,3-dioxygenase-like lactoylglutathione lyase family enzyme